MSTKYLAMADEVEKIANAILGYGPKPMNTQKLSPPTMQPKVGTVPTPTMSMPKLAAPGIWAGMKGNAQKTVTKLFTPVSSFKSGVNFMKADWAKGNKFNNGMLAFGAIQGLPSAIKKEDPTGSGRSRTQRMMQYVGSQAGGVIGAPHGVTGALVGSLAGDMAGGAIGKRLSKPKVYPGASMNPSTPQPVQQL